MTEPSSPLSSLMSLTDYLHHNKYAGDPRVAVRNGHPTLGGALCAYMSMDPEGETYSRLQETEAYQLTVGLCVSAEKFVMRHSHARALERNLSVLDRVTGIFYGFAPQAPAPVFNNSNNLKTPSLEELRMVETNLAHFNEGAVVSEDDIDKIVAAIDRLIAAVRKADIDLLLKDRLMQTLGMIRTQIVRVNVVGPNDVMDGLDMVFGQLARVAGQADTPEKKEELTPFFKTMMEGLSFIQQAVDTGQKLVPLLKAGAKAIGWVDGAP